MVSSLIRAFDQNIFPARVASYPSVGEPNAEFVTAKDADGHPISRYGDETWNRTAYDVDGKRSIISFKVWKDGVKTARRASLIAEIKWLVFLLMFRRSGRPISDASISNYLKPLRAIAIFCESRSVPVRDVLADHALMLQFLAGKDQFAKLCASLLSFLERLGPEEVGFNVAKRQGVEKLLRQATIWSSQCKQHPPIPTRIYSEVLLFLGREIDQFGQVADQLFLLLAVCLSNPLIGRCPERQWVKRSKGKAPQGPVQINFDILLEQYGLSKFWKMRGYAMNVHGLSTSILELSIVASLQVQAYTGMRANEVAALPYDCLEEFKRPEDGSLHFLITGRVRKLESGKSKPARWVTSENGRLAIRLAQRLSSAIHKGNLKPGDKNSRKTVPVYLFEPAGLLGAKKRGAIADLTTSRFKSLDERLPCILESDILELEMIDPHRAWRSEPRFQVGSHWHLTTHQLRRSLALYAQRSGLVSLPTLKRQMQHLTAEMSSYYGKGSAFAAEFIVNETRSKHFGHDWQEAQPVSQYLSYAINVLQADTDELFGAHAHWVKHRATDEQGMILLDREVTLKRFRKGELAYRETLLGGCVKVGECTENPLDILSIDCIRTQCKNMVGHRRKLERVAAAQANFVASLAATDPTSAEFRHERAILSTLQDTLLVMNEKS